MDEKEYWSKVAFTMEEKHIQLSVLMFLLSPTRVWHTALLQAVGQRLYQGVNANPVTDPSPKSIKGNSKTAFE